MPLAMTALALSALQAEKEKGKGKDEGKENEVVGSTRCKKNRKEGYQNGTFDI